MTTGTSRTRRAVFDRLSALALLLALSPLMVLRGIVARARIGRVLDQQHYHDTLGQPVSLHRFAGIQKGRDLARLFDIAAGRLAWVGPAPVPLAMRERASARQADSSASASGPASATASATDSGTESGSATRTAVGLDHQRSSVHPRCGVVSPGRVQRLTGSQYELTEEAQACPDHSLGESVAVLCRYLIARCLAADPCARRPARFRLLGVDIDNVTIADAMQRLKDGLTAEKPTRLAFVNPDCLNTAVAHPPYQQALSRMDAVFADGIGLRIACRLLGISQADNVNGTDFFPLICEHAARQGKSLFLLGGRPGIADAVAGKMSEIHPALQIVGTAHGYFGESEEADLVQRINQSQADILLVGFGAPRQELWLDRQASTLTTRVQIGVGGLFDFYSGRISRAPRWLRDIGLEWTWRLLQEPGRMWRRYIIGNPLFLYRVWRQAQNSPDHQVLKRFSPLDVGFLKASARFRLRHFAWTLAVFTAHAAKRLIDIAVAGTALLMLAPILLLIAYGIRRESPGPVLFVQTRVGRWGKEFPMYKFRSMCVDAEVRKQDLMDTNEMQGGVLFKMKQDPRITRLGAILRKYSLDELPQFWNVLKGDMSLVGPRPPVPSEVSQYSIADRRRLEVKPGITCTWQVSGRSEIGFEDQVALDVAYIESQDVMSDIRILFKTIPAVLMGKGAY